MITLLTNILPIVIGYIGKFIALRAEDRQRNQELMINGLSARSEQMQEARAYDTPMANASRRSILWFLMFIISMTVLGYAVFQVPVMVETVDRGFSIFWGLWRNPDTTKWIAVEGIVSHKEFLEWMAIIIEMYFGSTLARRG